MKWVTTNYKGDEQIWYSGDVIRRIKEKILKHCNLECKRGNSVDCFDCCFDDMLHTIEREEE